VIRAIPTQNHPRFGAISTAGWRYPALDRLDRTFTPKVPLLV